jgi:hypothetical protein
MTRRTFRNSSARSETLAALNTKFDDLLERMQTPTAKKGMEAAFNTSPTALARAAVKAVDHQRRLTDSAPAVKD